MSFRSFIQGALYVFECKYVLKYAFGRKSFYIMHGIAMCIDVRVELMRKASHCAKVQKYERAK